MTPDLTSGVSEEYLNEAYKADDNLPATTNSECITYPDVDNEYVIINIGSRQNCESGDWDMSTRCIVDLRDADTDFEMSSAGGATCRDHIPNGKEREKTHRLNHRNKSGKTNREHIDRNSDAKDSNTSPKNNNENIQSKVDKQNSRKNTYSPSKNKPRNVVYYQNRFIVLDADDSRPDALPNLSTSTSLRGGVDNPQMRMAEGRVDNFPGDGETETSFTEENVMNRERTSRNRRVMEMDASSVTMDSRGIEIILTDPENASRNISTEDKKKNTIWKKIHRVLLDNRMKGNSNLELIDNQNDYKILKKVLNITFLTIGVVLFLSVVIAVIYAFIVGDPNDSETDNSVQHTNSSTS